MVRPPMAPALMFCIDVSLAAVQVSVQQSPSHTQIPNHHPITDRSPLSAQSGATTSAVEAIARTLDSVPEPKRTLVGICTYDSVIHFYHMHDGMATPRMLVVPDADEPYSPLPAGMAVSLFLFSYGQLV